MIDIKLENPKMPERLKRMARAAAHPRRPFVDLGGHWQRRIKKSMPARPPGSAAPAGQPPAVHTSEYAHSILYDAAADGQSLSLGSSSIRARLLEKGGTVRARRARALAIPIAAESYGRRPRDFQGLEIIAVFDSDGQRSTVLGREGMGLFLLRKSVTIKPHPHIEMTQDDWDYFERALERELDREAGI